MRYTKGTFRVHLKQLFVKKAFSLSMMFDDLLKTTRMGVLTSRGGFVPSYTTSLLRGARGGATRLQRKKRSLPNRKKHDY